MPVYASFTQHPYIWKYVLQSYDNETYEQFVERITSGMAGSQK